MPRAILTFLLLALAATTLAAQCVKSDFVLSPLGAEPSHRRPIAAPSELRRLLPRGAVVRQMFKTHIAPAGETMVLYDFGKSFGELSEDNMLWAQPMLAAWDGRNHLAKLRFTRQYEAPRSFCEYEFAAGQHAFAIAYPACGDGSLDRLLIFAWRDGRYAPIFDREAVQSRLLLSTNTVTLYESDGNGSCVWCSHGYKGKRWRWDGVAYRPAGAWLMRGRYAPDEVTATPLMLNDGKRGRHPLPPRTKCASAEDRELDMC